MVRHGNGGSENIASVPFMRSNRDPPHTLTPCLRMETWGSRNGSTHDNLAICSDSVLERPMLTLQPTGRVPQGSAAAVARRPEDRAGSPFPIPSWVLSWPQ